MNINISSDGFDELKKSLQAMEARSVNTAPIMGRIGLALIASVHENFNVSGRPAWKPLSAKTVASYQVQAVQKAQSTKRWKNAKTDATRSKIESARVEKDVGGHKILIQTGELRNSIMLGKVTDNSVEIGSSLPYARAQQFGHKYGPVTIKARNKKALTIPTANGVILRQTANIPERTLPARPYLTIQPEDKTLIANLAMRYIQTGK